MKQYYLIQKGKSTGPLTFSELQNELITDDTLVWRTGMLEWLPAKDVTELSPLLVSPPPQVTPMNITKNNSYTSAIMIVLLALIAGLLLYSFLTPNAMELESTKKQQALEHAKTYARENINSLVLVESPNYTAKLLGGISGLKIAVSNNSKFIIDEVLVEVKYIKSGGGVFKTENLRFNALKPNNTLSQYASDSKRGIKIETNILSIKSNELDMY
jgi:hypothetical protein